jgi:porin
MGLRPTDNDELYVKLGFAVGNGLNEISPFTLRSWAADLQDDVQDINGLWDYLLNAWYKHRFSLGEEASLDATFGVIDATDYLDDNAYSNDEYSQFMNEALVNGPQAFLPSYAPGGALALDVGRWSARAVVMGIGKNDDGNNVVFYGGQLGYRLETPLGEGNYRLLIVGANRAFLDPSGTREEFRLAGAFSIDQQLGETFGVFLRIGWQSDRAAVNYDAIYSGGLNIFGGAWGRENDNIGLAYGYLNGGNQDLRGTHVAEVYYRLAATEHFGLTVDAQYMFDGLRTGGGPRGVILGLRATIEY